jgi:bifunctional non-homologous end joining protein LigD
MLEEYKKKRDFTRTKEPLPVPKSGRGELIFVVQEHSARRLHYDFRLELDGVLRSWAIPNGPSLDPKVKRLAVMVEDHPLEYGGFEGNIPKGEYGAGEVIIWDKGHYIAQDAQKALIQGRRQAEDYLKEGIAKGKLSFELHGQKLKGSWALVKLQHSQKDWLLIKHKDEYASEAKDIQSQNASVFSGLTLEELKNKGPEIATKTSAVVIDPGSFEGSKKASMPEKLSPMLATLVKKPFSGPEWFFEPKLDGYRVVAYLQDGQVKLISRNGLDTTAKFPQVKAELQKQTVSQMLLDGEMVALDESGRPCFQCLQDYANPFLSRSSGGQPLKYSLLYYVFDILYLNGYDLREVPLADRKKILTAALKSSPQIRPVVFENEGETLFEVSVAHGLEGVMAKRKDSLYATGKRSQEWLKIKAVESDEFVIAGFSRGAGNRAETFGSLLLGSREGRDKKLSFSGGVGTGFDDDLLVSIRQKLDKIKSPKSPFHEIPVLPSEVTWVKPELVAEVKFAERTREGLLRAPVFLRLREDKSPTEVISGSSSLEVKTMAVKNKSKPLDQNVKEILTQLKNPEESFNLQVEGNSLPLTNLEKELWPGVTKRQLLHYLTAVSPYMLAHLKDHPVTLTRYPHGVQSEHFYQRHSDQSRPDFVETASLTEHETGKRDFLLCNNLTTLLWLGQLAVLDLHSWFSRITSGVTLTEDASPAKQTPDFASNYPDFIVFDIDPYIYSGQEASGDEPELNKKAFAMTAQVAVWFKAILDNLELPAYVKTSGMTGLHVYVPIVRRFEYEVIHAASKTIAANLLQKHPQEVTMEWQTVKRKGKVFLDYNQNVRSKTLAAVYSPRHSIVAAVSTPLKWSELDKIYPTDFTVLNLAERLAKTGDLWAGILDKPGDLGKILK